MAARSFLHFLTIGVAAASLSSLPEANASAVPPPARVDGVAAFSGIDAADATTYETVFVKALADLAGVDRARAAVTKIEGTAGGETRRAHLAAAVNVSFSIHPPPGAAATVVKTLDSKTASDVNSATTGAAAESGSAHTVSVFNYVDSTGLKAWVAKPTEAATCGATTKSGCWNEYDCQWCADAKVCVPGNETCPASAASGDACSAYGSADCFRHLDDCHWCILGMGFCVVSSQPCP